MKEVDVFKGKYRIKKLLGKGDKSRVYLAENIKLGTLWAIKQIEKGPGNDNSQLVEPDILKKLDHPALPRIFDVIEDDAHIYIIVDYIEGTPLDKELKEEGNFSEQRVIKWGIQLCDVLTYLHNFKPNPIIYRDMKPSNIILTEGDRLKLVDFGIAREYKAGNPDDTVYIGTRGYAAPEQYGSGQTSAKSDIYSLGVTLHHLVTGVGPDRLTCEVRPIREFNDELSLEFEAILQKCTQKHPGDRYASADELKEALQACLSSFESAMRQSIMKINPRTFRRMVIAVWDNPEFACEYAYACARLTGMNVLLMDLDLLSPSVDLLLNIPRYPAGQHGSIIKKTGINLLIDAGTGGRVEGNLFKQASVKRSELKNLFIITGSYSLDDYEYYPDEVLVQLIDDAYRNFDITILILNRSIYDSFTVVGLARSDYIVIPLSTEVLKLRTFNCFREFLMEKQGISLDKYRFVAFDNDPALPVDRALLEITVGRAYIGCIRYSAKRAAYRNTRKIYAKSMEPEVLEDYRKLMRKFGIETDDTCKKGLLWLIGKHARKRLEEAHAMNE